MKKHKPYGPYERFVKRPLDFALSLFAIIILSPIFFIISILVRVKLGSPILFSQERPGRNEKIFILKKFRTMTNEKDKNGVLLPDDDRLPRFGRILRSTSLDELPELLNILKGDMAIIGPRPLLKEYLPYYSDEERQRHDVRPGLTGLAQIHGRNATTWKEKFDWDNKYVNKITFIGDVKILIDTVVKTVKRTDVLVGKEIPAGRLDVSRREKK